MHSASSDWLHLAASHPALTDDLALTLLKRSDLSPECLVALSKNGSIAKYRKVRLAIVAHARTPRHLSLPLLRLLYSFDLMHVALMPTVAADLKRAAEEVLLARLETISSGEKLSLARRASGRIAAELLLDKETRVMQAALENPRLTEASVAKVLVRSNTTSFLVEAVCHHPRWSHGREVRVALLRNAKTPLGCALEFARSLPARMLREILQSSRLPKSTKVCLLRQLEQPTGSAD
ncbi:MAG TPA: hypothetical protein VMT53_01295 [Terriglobales bacterium]|nr:hypothetical protein [Terriglobales bacterium]